MPYFRYQLEQNTCIGTPLIANNLRFLVVCSCYIHSISYQLWDIRAHNQLSIEQA